MVISIFRIIYGFIGWIILKLRYRIGSDKVVIVLPENVKKWNESALRDLGYYLERKSRKKAVVLVTKKNAEDVKMELHGQKGITIGVADRILMKRLMDYYCLHRFFDGIVFFFLNYPKDDNRSYYILKTTNVTCDELVCLGFYHLREIPRHV